MSDENEEIKSKLEVLLSLIEGFAEDFGIELQASGFEFTHGYKIIVTALKDQTNYEDDLRSPDCNA